MKSTKNENFINGKNSFNKRSFYLNSPEYATYIGILNANTTIFAKIKKSQITLFLLKGSILGIL